MTTVAYPSAIARACSALDEAAAFKDMPDGYFRVVVRIVKKINLARLSAPIVASRSTLAEESGKSVETVGRVVKWLEDRGMIMRHQKARVGLRGSSSPIIPQRAFLDALLLTSDVSNKSERKKAKVIHEATEAGFPVEQSYPQGLAVCADGSKSTNQEQPKGIQPQRGNFVRVGDVSLPSDLVWLVRNQGLKATGVLLLMRLAKKSNQRLSDVVAVTRKYLLALRGKALFAYIRALLLKDRDYGWQVKEETKSMQDALKQQRLQQKSEALCGRRFMTRNGNIFVTVEKNGILTEIRNGVVAGRPMDEAFLDALEDGKLLPMDGAE